jgi:hypothetical protein
MRKTIWLPLTAAFLATTAYGALAPRTGKSANPGKQYRADESGPRAQAIPAGARQPHLRPVRELGDSLSFAFANHIGWWNGKLVVLDISARHPVMVVDPASGKVDRAYSLRGGGPGEFLWAKSADPAGGSNVWINDLQAGRITLYDMGAGKEVRTLRTPVGLFEPVRLGDTLVSNGLFPGEILRFFVENRSELRQVRAAAPSPFGREHPDVRMILNRTTLAASPSRQRLVAAFFYANRLEFYDRHGRRTALAAGPRDFPPTYRVVPDPRERLMRWVPTDETRYAYMDVAATDARVYALFAGRRSGGIRNLDAFDGTEVHVFDWSGRLVEVMPLDVPVTHIVVDGAAHTLYGLRRDPYPIVVQFAPLPREII